MLVSELMHKGVITADVNDSLRAVCKIMKDNDIGSVPVTESGKSVGFVTDRDIALACASDNCTLDDDIAIAMNPDVISVAPDDDVTEAARLMEDNQISRLVVMDGDTPVGFISLQDLSLRLKNSHLKAEVIEEIKH